MLKELGNNFNSYIVVMEETGKTFMKETDMELR